MAYEITRGKIQSAQKVVVYGPEGIGKSTFAAQFPNPLFIDTEGSTKHMDVARLPKPSSWAMLFEQIRYVKANPTICDTIVIDSADWAESLCIAEICAKAQKNGIEDFGYGKGYTYLEEEFGRLLNHLEDLIGLGVHVVVTAHAWMRKIEQPDELGAYDHWEMKLEKKTAPLLKEWADMVLFANYKTMVVNVDGQGVQKGRNKPQGGKRVIYTTHHSCWDAKNRHELAAELDFEFKSIAASIPLRSKAATATVPPVKEPEPVPPNAPPVQNETTPPPRESGNALDGIPKALLDLMTENKVLPKEIQYVVGVKGNGGKGYYPADTPIAKYDPDFVNGALVGMWPQIYAMVLEVREADDHPL